MSMFVTTRRPAPTALDATQVHTVHTASVAVADGDATVVVSHYGGRFAEVIVTFPKNMVRERRQWRRHVNRTFALDVAERIVAWIARVHGVCTTCGRGAVAPFRVYAQDGTVQFGCRDAFHAAAMKLPGVPVMDWAWHQYGADVPAPVAG